MYSAKDNIYKTCGLAFLTSFLRHFLAPRMDETQFHALPLYYIILLYYDILWLYSIVCYVNFLSSWNYLGHFGAFGSMWPWLVAAIARGHGIQDTWAPPRQRLVAPSVQILWKYLDALMFSWCNHCLLMSDAIHWFMFSRLSKPQLLMTFFYEGLKHSRAKQIYWGLFFMKV